MNVDELIDVLQKKRAMRPIGQTDVEIEIRDRAGNPAKRVYATDITVETRMYGPDRVVIHS